jgi:hypothetical protein
LTVRQGFVIAVIALVRVVAVGWFVAPTAAGSVGIGSVSVGISEAAVELALTLIAVVIVLVVLHAVSRMRSRKPDAS